VRYSQVAERIKRFWAERFINNPPGEETKPARTSQLNSNAGLSPQEGTVHLSVEVLLFR
jgi:hypothetical protein